MPLGDSTQAGADLRPELWKEHEAVCLCWQRWSTPVIGIDTHRDNHEVEIADATGTPIATMRISNDSAGFTQLLAAVAEVAPGPRVAVSLEGSRSYGIGLARALTAAGLLVIECEQPVRKQRRGKGKSDPIDAHLAVLAALRLPTDRLPEPRADGDREALRILLGARQEITTASTGQTNRLRALLQARHQLAANGKLLLAIVDDIAPGLTDRYGVGPVSAAQAVVSFSHPGRCRNEAT